MCGIGGILARNEFAAGELLKLTGLVTHRGPDDEGYLLVGREVVVAGGKDTPELVWKSKRSNTPDRLIQCIEQDTFYLGMGHRRLSIIDLTAGGHQPFSDPRQKIWVVFNGEIYNYQELREQLSELGYRFTTESDTEVLLFSYWQWGSECLNRLEGMWSFVIYDSVKNCLFFARDRFGIKPLYYWISPRGDLYWGSEIKQFMSSPFWSARLNHQMALDYLTFAMTDHTSETMFVDVLQLPPGCSLTIDLHEFRSSRNNNLQPVGWYKPQERTFEGTFEDACSEFKERFFYAIKSHLQADVPVGSALSGGIDSSSIVCAINQLRNSKAHPQKTFSSCSLDPRFDERVWMEPVIAETGVEAHFVYPKGDDVFARTDQLIWQMDEPYQSQSVYLGAHVFEIARANGVKVLLNGQGADEYINCYSQLQFFLFSDALKAGRVGEFIRNLREINFSQKIKWFAFEIERCIPNRILRHLRKRSFSYLQKSMFGRSINFNKFQCPLRHPYLIDTYSKASPNRVSKHQLFTEPLPKYLRWEDRNSMAYSVEARVPFLCHRLVEFTRSLPVRYLTSFAEPKRIVTESLKGCLTESVRNRQRKMGFTTPEQNWLMHENATAFKNALVSNLDFAQGLIRQEDAIAYLENMQAGQIEFDNSYWRLIAFCIWMRVFGVSA